MLAGKGELPHKGTSTRSKQMTNQIFPCVTTDVIGGEREENAFYGETYAEVRAIADRRIADGDFAEVIFDCEL
jgi:hypothetical protein